MKEIKKGSSLLKFFWQSKERLIPMVVITGMLIAVGVYYSDGDFDGGLYVGGSILLVALIALVSEGIYSWKRL